MRHSFVLAGEQLAGDGFYNTNTASEEIVEIVIADAFSAFFLTQRSRRTTASKPYVSRFAISMMDYISHQTLPGQKLTSGNYLQCNRKIKPDWKPKPIPTQGNYPRGYLGQKASVTATISYIQISISIFLGVCQLVSSISQLWPSLLLFYDIDICFLVILSDKDTMM